MEIDDSIVQIFIGIAAGNLIAIVLAIYSREYQKKAKKRERIGKYTITTNNAIEHCRQVCRIYSEIIDIINMVQYDDYEHEDDEYDEYLISINERLIRHVVVRKDTIYDLLNKIDKDKEEIREYNTRGDKHMIDNNFTTTLNISGDVLKWITMFFIDKMNLSKIDVDTVQEYANSVSPKEKKWWWYMHYTSIVEKNATVLDLVEQIEKLNTLLEEND